MVTTRASGRSAAPRLATAEGKGLAHLVSRAAKDAAEADVPGLAAEMAHHSLFALFSLLLLLAGLTAAVDDLFGIQNMRERLVDSAKDVLPQNASIVIETFLTDVVDSKGQGALILGLFGVAWSGSNLVGSAMKALNRISRIEESRRMLERKLLAIGLALALGGMIVAVTVVVVFRSVLADGFADVLGWRAAAELFVAVVVWPLALMLIMVAASVLYWKGPDRDGAIPLGNARRAPLRGRLGGRLDYCVDLYLVCRDSESYIRADHSRDRGSRLAILVEFVVPGGRGAKRPNRGHADA